MATLIPQTKGVTVVSQGPFLGRFSTPVPFVTSDVEANPLNIGTKKAPRGSGAEGL